MLKTEAAGFYKLLAVKAFPGDTVVKNPPANTGDHQRLRFDPWVRKFSWRRKWQPTPVFLPGEFHEQRSLAGYSPWGCKELDTTERLSTHACKNDPSRNTYTQISILPSNKKKEQTTDTCNEVDAYQKHYIEQNRPD